VWETFSLLRSLARHAGGVLPVADCATTEAAIARIQAEVGDSYPAFALRNLDWDAICAAQVPRVAAAADPVVAMQEWLAALQDAHTWVRPAAMPGDLPYDIWVTPEGMRLARVPPGSAAWEAGARPGDRLVGEEPAGWWRRTAATPHSRPLVAGRRFLQDALTRPRPFTAAAPAGRRVTWTETPPADPWNPVAHWERLPSGSGYLQIRAWVKAAELEAQLDAAFAALRAAPGLIVDLRGNPGGDLALAQRFRNRFLPEAGVLGTIRYSTGHRRLSAPEPILGEPAPPDQCWPKPARFLTDPLTYSASEDVLLGVQGLPLVEVVGEPSGGGSGRVRVLRLLPGWRLMISTALTYDRQGRCVEGAGIPVDRPVAPNRYAPQAEDVVLRAADRGW
jgi:carboxyl-terminal processing protease